MYFKSKENVKQYCNERGYFIAKDTNGSLLAVKSANDDFKLLSEITDTANGRALRITVLREQLSNFLINPDVYLNSRNDWITVIDLNLYRLYDERKEQIEFHKAVLKDLKVKKGLFGTASKLIKGHTGGKHPEPCYYLVKDGKLQMLSKELVDDPAKQGLSKYNYSEVKRALKDNLENEIEEAYNQQVKAWEKISSNPNPLF